MEKSRKPDSIKKDKAPRCKPSARGDVQSQDIGGIFSPRDTDLPGADGFSVKPECETVFSSLPGIVYRLYLREDGRIKFLNDMLYPLTGYRVEELRDGELCGFDRFIVADDRDYVISAVRKAIQEKASFEVEYRFRHKDGGTRYFIERGKAIAGSGGDAEFIDGFIFDITMRRLAEEQVRATVKEKEVLLQEIHHRVKNNLQIIMSLLRIQSSYIGDKDVPSILRSVQGRIRALALIHEKLYLSDDLGHINLNEYIKGIITGLFKVYDARTGIGIRMDIEELTIGIDTAIHCGLIINELVSNSLKHAFPYGTSGEVHISLSRLEDGSFLLKVSDNGVGFAMEGEREEYESLGLHLVSILAEEQLEGSMKVNSGNGTEFVIHFREMPSPLKHI